MVHIVKQKCELSFIFLFDGIRFPRFIIFMKCCSDKKTRTPSQKRGVETREKIVEAALALFAEKGYHSTNSKEIASRSGVAIGSFYAYFSDKKALFAEALKLYCSKIEAELGFNDGCTPGGCSQGWVHIKKQIEGCSDIRAMIRTILESLMKAHSIYPGFMREIAVMRLLDPEIRTLIDEADKADMENMRELIRSIQGTIRVKNTDAAAYIVYRAVEVIMHETQTMFTGKSHTDGILEELTDMIYRYLYEVEGSTR